ELIGRLPIIASLQPLDQDTLIEILPTPKNALVKQHQKIFEMDDIEHEIEKDALVDIANNDIECSTSVRGLRAIIESIMLDIMFELPSRTDIAKCIITKETVLNEERNLKIVFTDGTVTESVKNLPKESA